MTVWNAEQYHHHFSFIPQYGEDLFQLIEGDKTISILDLGCGNGTLTNRLHQLGYKVLGMDSSKEQIFLATKHYPHLSFLVEDACHFTLPSPVDVVFSNAVFHWIPQKKHPSLIQSVYHALKPHGQFIFEMGGIGNNQLIHAALTTSFKKRGFQYTNPFYFPTIGEYTALLEKEGFLVTLATLFPRFTPLKEPLKNSLKDKNGLTEWIEMFLQAPFKEAAVPLTTQTEILSEVSLALKEKLYQEGIWHADYIRLRIKALKK